MIGATPCAASVSFEGAQPTITAHAKPLGRETARSTPATGFADIEL
ncbi:MULTISPECIES: hypothetical protein [unclassified Sphingopyxis]|nr:MULTISPECIES: hypothetical protein [unclassified Sphingopyxis]MDR7228299.1 hypothetical protein [Sphingopyxis sp. BE259]